MAKKTESPVGWEVVDDGTPEGWQAQDAIADSPLEQAAAGAANFIGPEGAREILPAIAGTIVGAATGGWGAIPAAGLAAAGMRAYQNIGEAAIGTRPLGSSGQQARELGGTALANATGEGISRGIGLGARALVPGAQRVGAQVMRVFTGVPEREGMAVLRDPSILSRAQGAAEAGAEYGRATGGIQGGAKGARQALGKSHFSGEAIADKFDEILPSILDESIDNQTLLVVRQRTMKAISDLPYNQKELRGLLAENIDQMDVLLEKRLPQFPGAKTGYREAKIAEEFGSALPLNKNLSPNVLRTTAAVAAAVKGAAAGRIWPSLALPLVSPWVWGKGIQVAAGSARAIKGLGNVGIRAGLGYRANQLPAWDYPVK